MTLAITNEATCKACQQPFQRVRALQAVCSFRCAAKTVMAKKKAEKEDTRARRLTLKTRGDWIGEAQDEFNKFIRLRDAMLGCVSCGITNPPMTAGGQWDAGHWKSRGARPELRFDESNCHKQCKTCNGGSKHPRKAETVSQAYRIELIKRIGLEAVEKLEGPHPAMHYSVDDLRILKHVYRQKAKELQA